LPQVSGTANLQHYFQLPTAVSNSGGTQTYITSGVYNYSLPQVTATQSLFSNDVVYAARAAKLLLQESRENTRAVKIAVVSEVTKAFYGLLLSIQQIGVYREDTARLRKNQQDAYHRYMSGVADKVDYRQASISLNNSVARLKSASENVQSKFAVLKQLMGCPPDKNFTVTFDTARLMQEIYTDTLKGLQFEKRIEYQILQTEKKIRRESTKYYSAGFMPSLSGFYNYVHEYENNKFSDLYSRAFPYSSFGLQLNIPVFSGFRRIEEIRKSRLQEQRTDWDEVNLKLAVYTEYQTALSDYKTNLYYLRSQAENTAMAREVYNIVKLQYSEGIKPYLDVIVAESDLQTSEINYLNALFSLLESKVNLERAMGDISSDI
jgi:outer membrane protein TolC